MTNTQNIILDLTNPHISPPPTVYAKQGDSGSRTVVAKIIDNGNDVTATAPCRVYFSGVGGGSPCYITGTMTSGAVTFTIPQTATMKSGTVKAEVQILNSENAEEVIATMSFDLVVKQTAYNVGAIVGGGGVNLADQYVDEVVSNHNASGDAHKNIQRNLEKYATDKDAETLTAAEEYADIKSNDGYSAAKSYADGAVSAHNESDDAHDKRFSALQSQLDEKVPQTYVDGAISDHDTDSGAHGALFGSINTQLQGISGGLAAAVAKGNATADTVALLQKYPCYEYAASGGAVQRFDDVSVIPHNICVTVHGATDESGNSVTNPTVSVYGKNMLYAENGDYYASSNRIKVNVTDGIFTATRMTETVYNNNIEIGGTFTPNVSGNYTVKAHGISANPNSTAVNVIVKNKTDNSNAITNVFIGGTAKTGTLEAGKEYQYIININSTNFNSLFPNVGDYITFKVQIEYGDTATDYDPAVEPQTVAIPITMGEGEAVKLDSFNAVSPTMMIFASDDNALVSAVDVTYNRDIGKALSNLQAAIAALV